MMKSKEQQTDPEQSIFEHNDLAQMCSIAERDEAPQIKAHRLCYLILERPNIHQAKRFFVDFGLIVETEEHDFISFRGRDTRNVQLVVRKGVHALKGFGFEASVGAVERLAEHQSKPITDNLESIGGKKVTLHDPNGYAVDVCYDMRALAPLPNGVAACAHNGNVEKNRSQQPVRYDIEPICVNKLGHSVIGVENIQETIAWYQHTLGMIVSDFQFPAGDALPTIAFLRFDCGDTPTDHHSIAIGSLIELGHVHSAFELDTHEELAISGEWLRRQDYKQSWGIGRHVLGSQIFDYWREPNGDLFEHYTDGDLFDSQKPTGYHIMTANSQHQWGPAVSKDFTGEKYLGKIFRTLCRRLVRNDDLTFARLARIIKSLNTQ